MSAEKNNEFLKNLRPATLADIQAEFYPSVSPALPEREALAYKYISFMMLSMARSEMTTTVLRRSQPLPVPELAKDKPLCMPTFDEVIALLKEMCGFSRDQTPAPLEGVFKVVSILMNGAHTVSVRFQDAGEDPRCSITMTKERS